MGANAGVPVAMTSTLTPPTGGTDDVLYLRDEPSDADLAIETAASFDSALAAACLQLCEGRPDLLAHAMWSREEGEPLRPLGKLFGDEAINYGTLASAIFRLGHEGTALTAAALRLGRPVWTASVPRFGWQGLGVVLRNHGIQSAGAFPIVLGSRVGAVIELLSFDKLQCDLASDALAAELAAKLAQVYRQQAVGLA